MYHFSLPLGAVAEIKAVAAEENIEEEPHGEGKVEEAPKKEKTYGKFSELKYGVSGVVTSKGNHQILDIKSFNYDGKGT